MDNLNKINKQLLKSGLKNSKDFLCSFLDNEDEIISLLKAFTGSKSEIYLKNLDLELNNILRFSSLFSDITIINTSSSPTNKYHFTFFDPEHKYYRERGISIPSEYLPEIGTDPSRFLPCYIHRNDAETKKIFQQYKPFLKGNRLLVRPLRALYVNYPELKKGTVYYVDPNTTNDHWFINKLNLTNSILIDNGRLNTSNITDLFEITLPYLKNIDLETFSKILEDENEILASFRLKITQIIKEAGNNPSKIEEIKNDIALSSIARLNKKFKQIQHSHRLVAGVTVGTFALTLSTANIDIRNIIEGAGITLGALAIANNDYQTKISDLKEDPYYLLWRLQKKS